MNEVAITLSEVLRRYPKKAKIDNCVNVMMTKIDRIDEPKSLACCVWMLGDYSEKIKNSFEIMKKLADTFKD